MTPALSALAPALEWVAILAAIVGIGAARKGWQR